jgi:hypothetical protein
MPRTALIIVRSGEVATRCQPTSLLPDLNLRFSPRRRSASKSLFSLDDEFFLDLRRCLESRRGRITIGIGDDLGILCPTFNLHLRLV